MAGRKAKDRTAKETEAMNQAKASKFVELGNKRTQKALKAIKALNPLGTKIYIGTNAQKAIIIAALRAAIDTVEDSFKGVLVTSETFKL